MNRSVLADGLDRLNTYTALLSDDVASYVPRDVARRLAGADAGVEQVTAIQTELEQQPQLVPFQAFAMGAGLDADGPYTAIVLLHADEQAARSNVQRLHSRIGEGRSLVGGAPFREFIDDAEISHDGRLVLAKLRTDKVGLWFALHSVGDTLLLHE